MPNAIVFLSAPKTPPGLTASTSRPRPPSPDTFLSSHLRRRAALKTKLISHPRRDRTELAKEHHDNVSRGPSPLAARTAGSYRPNIDPSCTRHCARCRGRLRHLPHG